MKFIEKAQELGHRLYKDENGNIDIWRLDSGDHNGPECERCQVSWCQHCGESQLKECPGFYIKTVSVQETLSISSSEKDFIIQHIRLLDELRDKYPDLKEITLKVSSSLKIESQYLELAIS